MTMPTHVCSVDRPAWAHRRARRRAGRDVGFTLIELLVVVIILGVLAAIAVPVYLNHRTSAVNASMKADIKAMALAQEACIADTPQATGFWVQVPPGQTRTVCGTGANAVTFTSSPGNTIEAHTRAYDDPTAAYRGSYCIVAHNPNSSARTVRSDGQVYDKRYFYSAADGGGAYNYTKWC